MNSEKKLNEGSGDAESTLQTKPSVNESIEQSRISEKIKLMSDINERSARTAHVVLSKHVIAERDALKKAAENKAHYNGHIILSWKDKNSHQSTARCANCGMEISVNALPEKGELDAYGQALSNECPVPFIFLAPFTMKIIN